MDIPPVAGRRQWLGLAVLTLPTLLLALDLSVLYLGCRNFPRTSARPASSSCGSPTATGSWWPVSLSPWARSATGSAAAGYS